jgi:hypothetical protein
MTKSLNKATLVGAFAIMSTLGIAQTEAIQPDLLNVHINQSTSKAELTQIQQDMKAFNIGFRYDMAEWSNDELQSIRFAVRLPDGTMRNNVYETIESDTDIWIRLEGSGNDRIFCAGSDCE